MGKHNFTKTIRVMLFQEGRKISEKSFTQGPVVFGRLPSSEVHLDYSFVSRQHCQVIQDGESFYLVDLGSRNGVYISGQTVDRYQIGEDFEFSLDKLSIQIRVEDLQASKAIARTLSLQSEPTIVGPIPIGTKKNKSPELKEISKKASLPPSPVLNNKSKVTSIPAGPLRPEFQSPGAVVYSELESLGDSTQTNHAESKPLLGHDFVSELVGYHPGVQQAPSKRIEAIVLWHNQVYEVREFDPSERITIGASASAEMKIPSLPRGWALAQVDFSNTQCFIPRDKAFSVSREGKAIAPQELLQTQQVKQKGNGFLYRMGFTDVLNVDLGGGMRICLRYIPATQKLPKRKLTQPDQAFKQAVLGSLLTHGIFTLLLMIFVPKVENVPQIENVPERFAKLLVEPPKPIIPIPEPPKPPPPPPEPPKKVVKPEPKKPEPRKVVKPEPKRAPLPKKLVEQNRLPVVVKNPPRQRPVGNPQATRQQPTPQPQAPPVNVQSLGALAALGAVSQTPTANVPQVNNIQINRNAGGAGGPVANTSGVLNNLPSAGGKLVAAGGGSVRTGGAGIGSGTAYGVQGLAGASGSRGVAAAVVGSPQLATSSGKTEGLTRAQVMAVVQKHLAQVQQCYERNLLSNPNLSGRMEFEWDIRASGDVATVRIRRSTVSGGDSLGECVKGVFGKMKFPVAKNGQGTTPNIGFPFGRL